MVDLAFELSYMLSDALGVEVQVEGVSFDPDTGRLCVKARVSGELREACIDVKPCKGLKEPHKQARCVSKTLTASEKLLNELASRLRAS